MRGRVVAVLLGVLGVLVPIAAIAAFALSAPVLGDSMNPHLRSGDRLLTTGDTPDRLDVVTLRPPGGSTVVVRRVIGVPGDQVRITGASVLVRPGGDGPWHTVSYRSGDPGVCCAADGKAGTDAVVVVPTGEYFVLGDNLAVSTDSRAYGFVAEADVVGVVWQRVWPPADLGTIPAPSMVASR